MNATLFRNLLASGVLVLAGLSVALCVLAQGRPPTTEQLGKDPGALRQLEEQRNAEQMRQQQGRQQQQQDQIYNDALRQQQGRQQADVAQGQAVLRSWQKRPPLAPEHNPLLGRWNSQGSGGRAAGGGNDIASLANALVGGLTAGLCDSMLGRGLIEFRPTGVVAIGRDGRERSMYRAEYRGGGSRVVVLPQPGQSFTHMIIDFNGADRASVAAVGCVLVRAGGGAAAAKSTPADVAAGVASVQWDQAGNSGRGDGYYVARSTFRRSGDIVKLWDMYDFKAVQLTEGKRFLSMRTLWDYDCAGSRRRMLAATAYSGHIGKGEVVGSEYFSPPAAWERIGPGEGYGQHLLKMACAKT